MRIRRDHVETTPPEAHVHPNQVTSSKAQLEGGAADVFGPGSGGGTAEPAVNVKSNDC
jgi:hypothetical protein